jgi:hypothetical protein
MLVDALQKVGASRSIVLDENDVILAGNGVVEAASEAGLTKVQVVEADGDTIVAVRRRGLSDEQKRDLAIYDNRTAELATWNVEQLAADLKDGLDLSPFFFDEELKSILGDGPKVGLTDPDAVPAERPTGIVAGDLFELGAHRLLCGDCTVAGDVARLMGNVRASAVVTDSPYGIGRKGIANDDEDGQRKLFDGVLAAIPVRDGVVINFQSPRLFPAWLDAVRRHGHRFERALWFYDETDVTFPWRGWLMTSQMALVSTIGTPEWPEDVPFHHDCYIVKTAGQQDDSGNHPTAKPIDVVRNLLAHTVGLVYEPFAGSGTTFIAGEQLTRTCYGIELMPSYCQVIIDRWEAFTGQKAVKVGEAIRV